MRSLIAPALAACLMLWGCSDDATSLADISGRVVGSGGTPVAGATVRIAGTDLVTVTSDDGTYEIGDVPHGNFTVQAEISSSGRLQIAESPLFGYSGAAVELADLVLADAGTSGDDVGEVTGFVLDADGGPVLGAAVELRDGGGLVASAESGAAGGFAFRDLAPGVYRVAVAVVDNEDNTLRGSRDGVTVGRGEATRLVQNANVVVAVESRLGTIEGTITDSAARPIAGAQVSLGVRADAAEAPVVHYAATTNALGAYVLTDVPSTDGGAVLTATAAGFATAGEEVSLRGGGTLTQDLRLSSTAPTSQVAPLRPDAVAYTYPTGAGASRQAYAAWRRTLGGRRARSGAPVGRSVVAGLQVEVAVAYNPQNHDDTIGQVLYRSLHSDRSGYVPVARSESPDATLLADLSDALSLATDYYYRLTSLGSGGRESALSEAAHVRPLQRLQASAPLDGDTGVSTEGFTFEWDGVDGAQGYQILLFDRSPAVAAETIYSSPVQNGARRSFTYDGEALEATTVYYWFAVAYDSADPNAATAETYTPVLRFTTGTR